MKYYKLALIMFNGWFAVHITSPDHTLQVASVGISYRPNNRTTYSIRTPYTDTCTVRHTSYGVRMLRTYEARIEISGLYRSRHMYTVHYIYIIVITSYKFNNKLLGLVYISIRVDNLFYDYYY